MLSTNYPIPILFIIFRRPEISKKAFEKIRNVRPSKLYLACDGARTHVSGEKELVEQTRSLILGLIDWECEVKTQFQKDNLGCAQGVFSAINWLFENESYGIIIEDDCVVQRSFFPFMQELLVRYEQDERVGMIDGANYLRNVNIENSYCFSKYKSTNGWATWKRAWDNMDFYMDWRYSEYSKSILANMGFKGKDIKYWKYRLKVIDHKEASAWDWQWYFTLASQNQLSIFPQVSLVSNIGFGAGATHTTNKFIPNYYQTDKELLFPLSHPKYILPDMVFDREFYKLNTNIVDTIKQYVPFKMKKIIKNFFRT